MPPEMKIDLMPILAWAESYVEQHGLPKDVVELALFSIESNLSPSEKLGETLRRDLMSALRRLHQS